MEKRDDKMRRDKEAGRYLFDVALAFTLFTTLRISSNRVNWSEPFFFYMISQIGCVLIVSCWMLTVQSRIIHRRVKWLMLGIGGLFLLYFFMQMTKYCLFCDEPVVCRYMWYGYYIPMTFIPLLALYIMQCLSDPYRQKINNRQRLLLIPAALISLGFITNDFHGLAFQISNRYEIGDKERTLGPVFFLYAAFMAVLFILGLGSFIRLFRKNKSKKKLIYPIIPLVIGVFYFVLYAVKPEWITINNAKLLEIPEAYVFMMIGFLEVCIQIGLIPSNMGYVRLFSLTGIPARIADTGGNPVYTTRGAENDFEESEDRRILQTAVTGGSFYYSVDLRTLNRLNRELDETTGNLAARNDLLRHENEIAEERERAEAAIRIYDRISEIVHPQILEIQELLSDNTADEAQFRKNLVQSAVLNAYIKRRSNMELEAQKDGLLPFKELVTAAAETLEYFKLSGAETFFSSSGEGSCPSAQIIRAYQVFARVCEYILGRTAFLTARLEKNTDICLRIMLNGKNGLPDFSDFVPDGCDMEYFAEENDAELLIRVRKGGDGL